MARHNNVLLYGVIADIPQIITSKDTGEYIRATFHLATLKAARDDGKNEKSKLRYDFPFIFTADKEMIKKVETYSQYDIIEIVGQYTTRKIPKGSYCPLCETTNKVEGNISYVTPIFMERRNAETLTEKQSMAELIKNRHLSNNITIIGNLCCDVAYSEEFQNSVYQIATIRKFYIKSDDPANKTDWPVIKTFGEQAKQDSLCLHKGSSILVEGYLHSRRFNRSSVCETCNQTYEWEDNITEIIPYAVEYLRDFTDPEEALRLAQEKNDQEVQAAMDSLIDS